ncbi:MAG: hypothetical protein ACLQUY_02335 [Ktedonobacterales bacterium]
MISYLAGGNPIQAVEPVYRSRKITAAFHSLPTEGVGTAHAREQAQLAAAALPGRVAVDDTRNYQSGWVEGYNTMHERASQPAAEDSMNRE